MMKMLTMFQGDDAVEFFSIIPPSEGYYTNFRMQTLSVQSVSQNPFAFYFGTNMDRDAFDEIVDATEFNVLPDVKNNAFFITYSMLDGDQDGDLKGGYTYHWGSKRVYVDQDDLINVYTKLFNDANSNNHWVLTADFVPKRGSKLMVEQQVIVTSETENFQADPIYVPETLENCIVEVVIKAPSTVGTVNGTLKLKKFDPGQQILTTHSFGGAVTGDIMSGGSGAQRRSADKNTLINLDFAFQTGGANMAEQNVGVPLLKRGQMIAYDFDTPVGSFATGPTVIVRISGFVKYQSESNDAFFLSHTELLDGNLMERGLQS